MKIALFGTGHLGKIHLKCIGMIPMYEPVGFYDTNEAERRFIAETFGWPAFDDPSELIRAAEVVDIVTPTDSHFAIAEQAMRLGKHVFIEKPVTLSLEEAETLLRRQTEYEVQAQVGHVERFNPVWMAVASRLGRVKRIEARRHAPYHNRGTEVSVVLDLMIHDLDLVLQRTKGELTALATRGGIVHGPHLDWAEARLQFSDGLTAHISASRVAESRVRKMSLQSENGTFLLDFMNAEARLLQGNGETILAVQPHNAIKMELETFLHAIQHERPPKVTLPQATRALELALKIDTDIKP